jgi:uncharacterized protein (TIGR03118 family)
MKKLKLTNDGLRTGRYYWLYLMLIAFAAGCHKPDIDNHDLRDFKVVNLVANTNEYNPLTVDPTLINGFGIAWSPTGIAWVNSVGGHVSELYTAEGGIVRPGIKIPSRTDSASGLPCGIVFSGGKNFMLDNGPAIFLFTGFDGVLSGWNGGNFARRLRAPAGASYTGLAIGSIGARNLIYGANFGQKKIDVWDTAFARVNMTFRDPNLPAEYSPYNIQAVGDYLFVMYSVLGADGHGVNGKGKGLVSVFKMDGSFVKRFASRGTLNNPWGVTMAPASFLEDKDLDGGGYDNKTATDGSTADRQNNHDPKDPVILVGNFGDGRINVYSLEGHFVGQLKSDNRVIEIEGLWALTFPPSTATSIDPKRLYFSAGPGNENDGVFGYLIKQ